MSGYEKIVVTDTATCVLIYPGETSHLGDCRMESAQQYQVQRVLLRHSGLRWG